MSRRAKVAESSQTLPPMRPALTPEARENQMISLAMDLAEKRLRDGSASSQEVTHFLKIAASKEIDAINLKLAQTGQDGRAIFQGTEGHAAVQRKWK